MSKVYGYARCSTNEDKQDINRQIKELKIAGAEEVVFEYEHGDAKVKQNLNMLLDTAQEGDTIITLEVSRLSRSTQQLCEIVEVIKKKKLRLIIVGSITVDCRNGNIDPMSQAFIQMSAVFSELELSIIRARVRSGMRNAKEKGVKVGRRPTTKDDIPPLFYKHYPAFMSKQIPFVFASCFLINDKTIIDFVNLINKSKIKVQFRMAIHERKIAFRGEYKDVLLLRSKFFFAKGMDLISAKMR